MARMILSRSLEASIEYDLYLPAILHGLINGLIDIHPVLGAKGNHVSQSLQGLGHLGLGQGTFLGIVAIPPVHGHLDGRLISRYSTDPHSSRMISGMSDRRGPSCSNPLAPSVMGLGLFF